MKKILIMSILLLVGCTSQPDGKPFSVDEICIKGVVYYNSGYKLAPAFKPNGTLYTCEMFTK